MISRMLFDMGVLKKGHLVEVTRKDLVGQYSGETAKLTAAAVEKAVGGVLFIDEAYALKNEGSSDSHGQEAINTLIKELEDKGSEILVMLAG
jgi:SpoVK/Ycf46/Vps4 family AAA+-type ATPase